MKITSLLIYGLKSLRILINKKNKVLILVIPCSINIVFSHNIININKMKINILVYFVVKIFKEEIIHDLNILFENENYLYIVS